MLLGQQRGPGNHLHTIVVAVRKARCGIREVARMNRLNRGRLVTACGSGQFAASRARSWVRMGEAGFLFSEYPRSRSGSNWGWIQEGAGVQEGRLNSPKSARSEARGLGACSFLAQNFDFVSCDWVAFAYFAEISESIIFASRFPPRPFGTQCRSLLRDCSGVWLRLGVLRDRRWGLVNGWILMVFCCYSVHCFLGCLCWEIAGF